MLYVLASTGYPLLIHFSGGRLNSSPGMFPCENRVPFAEVSRGHGGSVDALTDETGRSHRSDFWARGPVFVCWAKEMHRLYVQPVQIAQS